MHKLGALALAALLFSCAAERSLRVTSDPPGADVWLDGELVGTTPVDVEFFHYGRRHIVYRLADHGTATLRLDIEPPWYARFPADIFTEVLLPIGWEDRHSVHAVLLPGEEMMTIPTLRSVLDRAEALRRAGPRGPGELPPVVPATAEAAPEAEDPEEPEEP